MRQIETADVTIEQGVLFFLGRGFPFIQLGSDGVENVSAGETPCLGHFCAANGLRNALRLHNGVAVRTQARSRRRMYHVVDAAMARTEAPEQRRVARVGDR